jgi:hypothetical protein
MHFRPVAQRIQDRARLDPRNMRYRIDFQNPVHVLREIQNNRHVAALTREAGAGSPRQYRRSISAALRYGCDHIIVISRNDEPDRNLSIVRSIGRVQRATASVEADLAANLALQCPFEVESLREPIDRFGVRAEWQRDDH